MMVMNLSGPAGVMCSVKTGNRPADLENLRLHHPVINNQPPDLPTSFIFYIYITLCFSLSVATLDNIQHIHQYLNVMMD